MHARHLFSALAACVLALGGCNKADQGLDARIHDYIVNHPEVVQEAINKLQAKQDAADAAKAKITLAQYRQALEHDPRDFVANPGGRITLTEFYDYRCPHCISVAPVVVKIVHDNPDVRVVFKEFPIFGAVSERAAAGAIALKKQGGDVVSLYSDFMSTRPLDPAAIDRILRAHGVNPSTLDQPAIRDEAQSQLLAVRQLAINLGIEGTPAFVIGDTIVPGDDTNAVVAAINAARTGRG